jgi:DNA-binding response OmpR family regulator
MEERYKVLIVDDEKDLCEILQFNLESEGFDIDIAYSGEEALEKPIQEFDLILLDVMMAGMTGYKVANIIRKELNLSTPIIFLTAKGEENDILTGFNVGGDDYISKPYSIKEVIARVKAILKRGIKSTTESKVLSYKTLSVDVKKKSTSIENTKINLTRKEFEILSLLMKNLGIYVSRDEILQRVWQDDVIVTERNVDVNIARLRKKIGIYGKHIKGKSGYGYCFQ